MKAAFVFGLVLLGVLQIDARHSKKKSVSPAREVMATRAEKPAENPAENNAPEPGTSGFAFPGFAVRIPIMNFGVLGRMKEQIDNIMRTEKGHELADGEAGYKGKTKTRTKTSNSTHGPFKTYTVTTEIVAEGNKTAEPKVISKLVKTVTTLDKNKLPKGKQGVGLPFSFGPRFGMKTGDLDIQGEKCSSSSDCKDNNKYCDAFFSVCKERFQPGSSCTQKDACDSKAGRYRCTWGRCVVNSDDGSAGTFCDSDSECHATSEEELGCTRQPDLSRFTSVCTPKLSEGSTCGRAGIFDLFKHEDELSSRCKTGLLCEAVGFFGRKACIRPLSDGLSDKTDEQEDEKEDSNENDKQREKKGSRKHKVESSTQKNRNEKKLKF